LWQEWSQQDINAMDKMVADIVVETSQNTSVKHWRGGRDRAAQHLRRRPGTGEGETSASYDFVFLSEGVMGQ
jgi:hypothetical protein